ncbi:MAG TPA: flagellar biosynthesis anti-sigma factor FlgM [Clostridiaceae bacterium]|nr:flagellar biosynthesis anti-sigma factor FlgM [Clostridiaceae bacterium]
MKIWGGITGVSRIYDKQKKIGRVGEVYEATSKKDVLSISNNAKDYQTVLKSLKNIPDIRKEKVKALIEKYETGRYNVNGRDVADKIIKSIIDKKI